MESVTFAGKAPLPHYDLLRALQVSDTDPVSNCLELVNVEVVGSKKSGIPISLEAIAGQTVFRASLSLDFFLMGLIPGNQASQNAVREIQWNDRQLGALVELTTAINRWTRIRLQKTQQQWQNDPQIRSGLSSLIKEFQLMNRQQEFMLQVGWGGGWDSKTFGDILTHDPAVFQEVLDRYQRAMVRQGKPDPARYPTTRRMVVSEKRQNSLMGWIKVRMERV
ncbi:MAG: type III-A CRISPR-associated RAMP protein Csm5 [Chloroflexi bacterium]|nr:type III-A CRISPR-associated RAMP protein Csm5 [Chloroflexota bacterium]